MPLVKVPGTPFVRDTQSMAIINTDTAAKEEYLAKSRILNNQKEQINKLKDEVGGIKNELDEIKQLLQLLINKE
jgi:hypothetical protein